jgi:hypothetical protein
MTARKGIGNRGSSSGTQAKFARLRSGPGSEPFSKSQRRIGAIAAARMSGIEFVMVSFLRNSHVVA